MKSAYNLVLLEASSRINFSHIIKKNQRLNQKMSEEGGSASLTTLWFKTQKYVREQLGEPFRPVLATPIKLGIDLLGDCTELRTTNPLFASRKVLDLNGQIAVSAQPATLRPCPGENTSDDGLTDFSDQTYVELFYDVGNNTGVIYRATAVETGKQLDVCLGDDVRGYESGYLNLLPSSLRRCPNLVAVLPEFEF